MSYLSCDNDSLDDNYYTLAAAIVQQAAVDYRAVLETIFALRTPPSERTKKHTRRINHVLNRREMTEAELLEEQFQAAERIERFFYSKQYWEFTDADPDKVMDAIEHEAEMWLDDKIRRGKQLKINGLRNRENGLKEFLYV